MTIDANLLGQIQKVLLLLYLCQFVAPVCPSPLFVYMCDPSNRPHLRASTLQIICNINKNLKFSLSVNQNSAAISSLFSLE